MNSGRFKPGQSGNPHGRGTLASHKKRLAADLLEKHVEKAMSVIEQQLSSGDESSAQWAAKMVMEYVYGKPHQAMELTGADGEALFTMSVTPISIDKFADDYAPKLIEEPKDKLDS